MRVRDIMTKIVVTIPSETSVEDAARIMKTNGIGLLPIGDKEEITGVITDRDITVCRGEGCKTYGGSRGLDQRVSPLLRRSGH